MKELRYCKARKRPSFRMSEAEYNVLPRYAHFHEFIHHVLVSDILQEPDFAISDVKMIDYSEHKTAVLPARLEQLEVVVFLVCHNKTLYLRHVGGLDFGLLSKVFQKDVLVFFYFIH